MITAREALQRVIDHREIFYDEMLYLMRAIMNSEISPLMTAAILAGLRVKKETVDEIAAAASVMRELCAPVVTELGEYCVDVVGTGGDGSHSFNISTCAAFVTAAAGVTVAKHGNRSVSSNSGSADVLESLGARIDLNAQQVAEVIKATGMGFMFAPNHHPAMKAVAAVRKELGVRTLFNILGPLTNPAGVPNTLMGVFHPDLVGIQVRVLERLRAGHVLVIWAHDGMDEISLGASTMVAELCDGVVREYEIHPEDFSLAMVSKRAFKVENVSQSQAMLLSVLRNEICPARDIVALNAGAALYCANKVASIAEGLELALSLIASGAAMAQLKRFTLATQSAAK